MQSVIVIALIVVIAFFIFHQYYPNFLLEGFADAPKKPEPKKEEKKPEPKKEKKAGEKFVDHEGFAEAKKEKKEKFQDGEGFADLHAFEGPAQFGSAESPSGCYPRDQLTPSELMPKDMNSTWAEQNPMGVGSLKGKNFLSAGALIGVNTVGQSLRNSNLQLRSEPPCPQGAVSIWNTSTIPPDTSHRPLEIGSSM